MAHVNRRAFMTASMASAVAPSVARAQAPSTNGMAWATMSRAERDAAYDNGAAVSDSSQIVERWVAASTTFRGQRSQHIDLAYGPGERNSGIVKAFPASLKGCWRTVGQPRYPVTRWLPPRV